MTTKGHSRSSRANPTGHPARFSPQIVAEIVRILADQAWWWPRHIHDPYAGTGERLGEIVDWVNSIIVNDKPMTASGTEIEPEWIVRDDLVFEGDATDPSTYPTRDYAIVTSPVYPNGMADSWRAADESRRNTYRHRLRDLRGFDEELHPNDMARWGYRGRGEKSTFRQTYWRLAEDTVRNWDSAAFCIVNVSDFVYTRGGTEVIEPVVNGWASLLRVNGWEDQLRIPVGTPRLGHGANRDKRVENEEIILAKKP